MKFILSCIIIIFLIILLIKLNNNYTKKKEMKDLTGKYFHQKSYEHGSIIKVQFTTDGKNYYYRLATEEDIRILIKYKYLKHK